MARGASVTLHFSRGSTLWTGHMFSDTETDAVTTVPTTAQDLAKSPLLTWQQVVPEISIDSVF